MTSNFGSCKAVCFRRSRAPQNSVLGARRWAQIVMVESEFGERFPGTATDGDIYIVVGLDVQMNDLEFARTRDAGLHAQGRGAHRDMPAVPGRVQKQVALPFCLWVQA